jgi:hypothetical protein
LPGTYKTGNEKQLLRATGTSGTLIKSEVIPKSKNQFAEPGHLLMKIASSIPLHILPPFQIEGRNKKQSSFD